MDNQVASTVRSLERNGFHTVQAETIAVARSRVIDLVPIGATVGIGDSVTVRQLGVLEELEAGGRILINPFARDISVLSASGQISEAQRWEMHKMAVGCQFYMTGTNVVTQDGKLFNTDAGGNRVAGMIFGPKNVIVVVGRNKIVPDLEAAFTRMKQVVAPQLCKIKGRKAPCVETGVCVDCHTPERACHVTTIIERAPTYTPFTVVLVDEDLGLGWDPDWPHERIERIYRDCAGLTWLKRRKQ